MSHIPAGHGPNGEPLTAIEGATLMGLQKWIVTNGDYFRKSERYSRILLLGMTIWLAESLMFYLELQVGIFGSISIILVIVTLILRKNLEAKPVGFPIPVRSSHPYVKYRGNSHLVSTSPDAELSFSLKSCYPQYQIHLPKIGDHESQHQLGIRGHSHLSLGTIGALLDEVREYSKSVIDAEYDSKEIKIIIGKPAEEIRSFITNDFSQGQLSLCENTGLQEQNSSESEKVQLALDSIAKSIDKNIESNQIFVDQVRDDIGEYWAWRDKLIEISNNWTGTVLLSARDGWGKMAEASENASKLLTESVQGRIDAIKVKIEEDANQAVIDLESKMQDVEADVAAKGLELENKIEAQKEIAKLAENSRLEIQNSQTPTEISLSIPVPMVSGGGGSVSQGGGYISGVTTSISYQTVSFPNPAFQVKGHVLKLATSISDIEKSRFEGLINQKSGLANIITDRKERINERKEQRKKEADQRMEKEREVALRHARLVESVYGDVYSNDQLLDFRDIDSLVEKSWSRPSDIVKKHIDPIEDQIDRLISILDSLEQEFSQIESYFSPSKLSPLSTTPVISHWAHFKGNALGFVSCQPLDVFQETVVIRPSSRYHLLQPEFDQSALNPMNPQEIKSIMQSLQTRGFFLPRLLKHLEKIEIEEICLTDSNSGDIGRIETSGGLELSDTSAHEEDSSPPSPFGIIPPEGGA